MASTLPQLFFRLAALAAFVSASPLVADDALAPNEPLDLFNGRDLVGWAPYARDAEPPASGTWQVADGVIRCSGRPNGYLRTTGRYQNYRLTVEWRWTGPAAEDAQGRPRSRNSGVLLHLSEPDAIWPKSLEAQLMEGNAGDLWIIGGVDTAEHAAAREQAVAAAGNDEEALKRARGNRRLPKPLPSAERPVGEWNTYDIVCAGDTVTVRVNSVQLNRVSGVTVRAGHIALQSEGAPIEFRRVRLEPLK